LLHIYRSGCCSVPDGELVVIPAVWSSGDRRSCAHVWRSGFSAASAAVLQAHLCIHGLPACRYRHPVPPLLLAAPGTCKERCSHSCRLSTNYRLEKSRSSVLRMSLGPTCAVATSCKRSDAERVCLSAKCQDLLVIPLNPALATIAAIALIYRCFSITDGLYRNTSLTTCR